jgi:PAS domain S-box-containing protein
LIKSYLKRKPRRNQPKEHGLKRRFGHLNHKRAEAPENHDAELRSIFAASPDAITVTDLKGKIIECNQAALDVYGGSSRQDLIGKNSLALIVRSDRKRAMENMRTVLKKDSMKNVEYVLLKKDGSKYSAELSVSVVKDARGKPSAFVGIIKDITERKQTEQAVRENQQKFERFFRSNPESAIYTDAEWRIVDANPRFTELFKYTLNQVKGKKPYEVIVPQDKLKESRMLGKKSKKGYTYYETVRKRKNGSLVPVSISAAPITFDSRLVGYVTLYRDITERNRIEQQLKRYSEHLEELVKERTRKLQESEEHFRSVVDYASEVIVTIDTRGSLVFWNKAAEAIFGYSAKEAIGKPITFIIPNRLRKNHQKTMHRMSVLKRFSLKGEPLEVMGLRKDGSEFPIELSFSVWKTRQRTFFTGVMRDITERKRMEERLSALNLYSGKLNAAKDRKQIYKLTLDALKRTLGFETASFMIVEKGHLKVVKQGGYQKLLLSKLPLDGSKKGITVKCAVARRPIFVPDVSKNKDYAEGTSGVRSELAVPIMIEDEVLGVLNVESRELDAFDEKDVALVQILACHAATAMNNLANREEIEKRNKQQASLMKSSAEMIHSTELRQRLQAILDAIKGLGWRRVVLSVRSEDLDITKPEDIVAAGLTEEEREFLWTNRQPGQVWQERFGPEFERFRIGEFYYLPWSDPWVKEKFSTGTVESHLKPEEMVDWNPDDLLYAPLRLADGRIVGVVSVDDPLDGRRPTKESLTPMELFLHQAAVAIENAKLLQQLKEYSEHLEEKVGERTVELRGVQKQLLKSERLAAIGELAGMVGHDLRNPLTGISGATYYLKTKYGLKMDDKGKEMLGIIEKDIGYSNKIINDLLEYSKEIKLEITETTPRLLLKEALSFVQVPKTIQILERIQSKPRIKVDVEKIRRVFINIIKNAFDAMPYGGQLTIRTRKAKDKVAFIFSDTGIGMSNETMKNLWTPLFTTKARGMGFGLAICKRILEAHEGQISVESMVGEGTTFTVTVPIEPKSVNGGEKVWVNEPESLLLTTTKA